LKTIYTNISNQSEEQLKYDFSLDWLDWRDAVGGNKIVFLREFLKQFRLA